MNDTSTFCFWVLAAVVFLFVQVNAQGVDVRAQDYPVRGIHISSSSPLKPRIDLPRELLSRAQYAAGSFSGALYLVTTTNDTGDGSLRKAIVDANANPGADTIKFNIPPAGPKTIVLLSKLPNILDPVTIDGTTQPGFAGSPMIELNCASIGAFQALDVFAAGTTIRGLVINRLTGGTCIVLWEGSNGSVVEGNFLGTNLAGTLVVGNAFNGIISRSANNRIGGTATAAKNVFAGHGNPAIALITGANGNIIQGNLIGTDVTGTVRLGNTEDGILIIFGARDDTIGGASVNSRNVISGSANFSGIAVIGTGPAGTRGIRIAGNYIGTDVTGNLNFGNARHGIYIRHSPNNLVGGVEPGAGNVVAGSGLPGIQIDSSGATSNVLAGNIIGTRPNGMFALANSKGIVLNEAPGNIIGGSVPGARNLITGNSSVGIEITGAGATGNKVRGNYIGTNLVGQPGPRNLSHGILLSASQDTIGGLTPEEGNLIAYNTGAGVLVASGTQNAILNNRMRLNTGLGIDLAPAGVTVNDSLDPDIGPNALQNFPLLDSAVVTGASVTIHGRLNSWPNAQYTLHFYRSSAADASHFGEGDSALGTATVLTDASGTATFSATFAAVLGADYFITATATNALGNTSEFSQALCANDLDGDGILDSWETQGWGIDVNSDTVIDLDLYALGARPAHKDLFVEVDAMSGLAPSSATLLKVRNAFASVPNQYVGNPDGAPGVNLHLQLDDTTLGRSPWLSNWWTHFHNIKRDTFGTALERNSPNRRFILEAKRLVFRYCIFAHSRGSDGVSGQGELPGNDFMVTLGDWTISGGTPDEQAGTFMHELGHTLGLLHGGVDNVHFKPNYFSVMNYAWQVPFSWQVAGEWKLNYSVHALDTLDESMLDEQAGLHAPVNGFPIVSMPYTGPGDTILYARLRPNTPVDWNGNGVIDTSAVSGDLNRLDMGVVPVPVPDKFLAGRADWPSLTYNFRTTTGFNDENPERFVVGDSLEEMNLQLRNALDSLPPPLPRHFIMDGQLDAGAVRVTSGDGIALYCAYRESELYVATNSAQSQNADMFIFVTADLENPGIPAPWQKAGHVAAWDAFLGNESANNAAAWYDATGTLRRSIAKATAGPQFLEGVIDLEYMAGRVPFKAVIAVGKYQTQDGGALISQAPFGDGDGDIEAGAELYSYIPGVQLHWYQTAGPNSDDIFSLVAVGTSVLYAGSRTGIFKTSNAGDSWSRLSNGLPAEVIVRDLRAAPPDTIYAATDSGIYISSNGGANWQRRSNGLASAAVGVLPTPQGNLFAGTLSGGYRSTDQGLTWTLMSNGLPSGVVRTFAVDSNGFILAGLSADGMYRSMDDGVTWSPTGMSASNVRKITVDQLGRIYYVKSSPSIVFRSSDGGNSWTNILQTSMGTQQVDMDAAGRIFAATAEGVLLSMDDGNSWDDITNGVPGQSTWSLVISENNIAYVGTFNNGVCRNLSSAPTSVIEQREVVPTELALRQNYPNPFNPATRIEYALPKQGYVLLTIFNVLGQQVARLVGEVQTPGTHVVDWNAQDKSSGVYFYRLQAGDASITRKMLLIR